MHIVHYSQHVLGVGHLFRSLEIVRALKPHPVTFVTGGREMSVPVPGHVRHFSLPPLMMDADFKSMLPGEAIPDGTDPTRWVENAMHTRRERLLALMRESRPDILLVELFPFGRKKFSFELLPILQAAKAGEYGTCTTVCSLRDILVEKKDRAKFESRVLKWLNPLFDQVLVHADPNVVRLEETFNRTADIIPAVQYTGYVTPAPAPGADKALRADLGLTPQEKVLVVSAGSGSVCGNLLAASLSASHTANQTTPHRLFLFSGPYMSDAEYTALQQQAEAMPHATVRRFTSRFPDYLAMADASISMAGYNTTMNLLAADTHGHVLPFDQNREQRMRCERLQDIGALTVLSPSDLSADVLPAIIADALENPNKPKHSVDLNGAQRTAKLLTGMVRQ